ncbi:MAG: sigma-70 family RNA polymerase sigma factor [Nitrospira sp. SB0675_bin_23]|nr:sigma-70 family RNA polymerase sigma factor [Nitrospira sp. SB0675_bin_23]
MPSSKQDENISGRHPSTSLRAGAGRPLQENEHSSPIEAEFVVEPEDKEEVSENVAESGDDSQAEQAESTALAPTTALGRYLVEIRRYPFLSKEEELQLFHEYQVTGSRDAAVKLVLSNLRVSVAIASEYGHTGADQMDLIQEGNVGLMQAIKKFDVSRNVRFYAYAAWWVRAYILRYLLQSHRLVKIGTTQEQRKLFYNLKKEKSKLEREGFVPDAKLLADRLQVRERDVLEMDQRLGSWELSLDQPISKDREEGTFLDFLPAPPPRVDATIAKKELMLLFRKKLGKFSKTLDERDEDILRNRLLSETPLTLEEIGRKYSITKERSRQLEARIIKRLREFMKAELQDFDVLRN